MDHEPEDLGGEPVDDVDAALAKVEAGERYRGAWWRRIVKPGLETFEDVEKPARGASEWQYTGDR
jgi:hypothetical protein